MATFYTVNRKRTRLVAQPPVKRIARKYGPADPRENFALLVAGAVVLAIILIPVIRFASALLTGGVIWAG